jgi:adenine-specific DNA-methyltransferase
MEILDSEYVSQPMLTCIGNKRKLIPHIEDLVKRIGKIQGKDKLKLADAFAGSGVVSRMLSLYSEELWSNDLESYSALMGRCFLEKPSKPLQLQIMGAINGLNHLASTGPYVEGIITNNYAPKETDNVLEGERCFYTHENALIIDTLREKIETLPEEIRDYCLAPLVLRASIHANTAGVFKGFYKKNGIGCFGGSGEDALSRIKCPIELQMPKWNRHSHKVNVCQLDVIEFLEQLPVGLDIIYLDPPYNQHPYGSNYFMLNLIIENKMPESNISKVSGIPDNWNRSAFNKHKEAVEMMAKMIELSVSKSEYTLLSYNDEGIVSLDELDLILQDYDVERVEIEYDTYKGSRNLANRNKKVNEIIYIISESEIE